MAYLLFIDESGHDRRASQYEVLAGLAIEDRQLWRLIRAVQSAEIRYFGRRYSSDLSELKGRKLLKKKTFRQAGQLPDFEETEQRALAKSCLDDGSSAGILEITALAQAKLAYVGEVFSLCLQYRCKAFASVVDVDAPRPEGKNFLRKDYAYLFERFFYFLDDHANQHSGIVVFDELERSQSHLLVNQMSRYFVHTKKGQTRASLVVPEPFFVHSDLTTGVQLADLIAYCLSWGLRLKGMEKPRCQELDEFVDQLMDMRHLSKRSVAPDHNRIYDIWSITYIDDLRGRDARDGTL